MSGSLPGHGTPASYPSNSPQDGQVMDIQDMEDVETRLHGSVAGHVGEQGFTNVLPSVVSPPDRQDDRVDRRASQRQPKPNRRFTENALTPEIERQARLEMHAREVSARKRHSRSKPLTGAGGGASSEQGSRQSTLPTRQQVTHASSLPSSGGGGGFTRRGLEEVRERRSPVHLVATALPHNEELAANRERHEDEAFKRQRLHRHAVNAMEQALSDDRAPLFAPPDYAALRHMKNVALVHNFLGDTKVPSDVRIAVEALKGKDPMAAVLKFYMDANPDEFMPFLRALPRSDRPEEMASFEGIQAMNSLAAHVRSHIAPEEHIAERVAAYNSYMDYER